MKCLVCGAGGAIGGYLARRLLNEGFETRCVDIKPLQDWWQIHDEAENIRLDLREVHNCHAACDDIDHVFQLAANMGGIGHITKYHAAIALDNTEINVGMLRAAVSEGVSRYLFSSSACVYNQMAQSVTGLLPLHEDDAWPADPEPGYGLEKLYAEKLCEYCRDDHGLSVRVVRFHNVFGRFGDWQGGREKAPAAACRKIAEAKDSDTVEIWGDGLATRSFMHVYDCIKGLMRLMESDYQEPVNLGREEMVTINELFEMVADIAGKQLTFSHDLTKPQGVRGRNSDNSRLRVVLGWEPQITLREGLEELYPWIESEVKAQ